MCGRLFVLTFLKSLTGFLFVFIFTFEEKQDEVVWVGRWEESGRRELGAQKNMLKIYCMKKTLGEKKRAASKWKEQGNRTLPAGKSDFRILLSIFTCLVYTIAQAGVEKLQ